MSNFSLQSTLALLAKNRLSLVWAILTLSAALTAAWLWRTWTIMPTASIADFVLATSDRIPAIERGDWGEVVGRFFEPFGGHIVAYTRFLQLINFVFFDYSPEFVRVTGILALVAAIVSFSWLALRQFGLTLAGAALFAFGNWLIASPTIYGLVSWPDSLPPYYSVFIVICLMLPWCVKIYSTRKSFWLVAVATVVTAFAMIIGSGVGWIALIVLPLLYLFASGVIDRTLSRAAWRTLLVALVVLVAVIGGALFGALQLFKAFETQFVLDEPRRGIELAWANMDVVLQYFFASLATGIVLEDIYKTWIFGAVPFAFFLVLMSILIAQKKTQPAALWIAFCLIGLGSEALTTLTRWHFVLERNLTMASQYYSVFALPFYVGLAGLVVIVVRQNVVWVRSAVAGVSAILVAVAVYHVQVRQPVYADALKTRAANATAGLVGAANRNLALTTELTGTPLFVYRYQASILPQMKRLGKYRAITDRFISSTREFLIEHGLDPDTAPPQSAFNCDTGRLPGRLMSRERDTRNTWRRTVDPPGTYVRFVGMAFDPEGCNTPAEYVAAIDPAGQLLCISRPAKENLATVPSYYQARDPVDIGAQFDFSCPIDSDAESAIAQMSVWVFSTRTNAFGPLEFDSSPTDPVTSSGELRADDGIEVMFLNGKAIRIDETRAGWLSDNAGRIEGESIKFSGWVLDRLRNETADLVLVFADGKLVQSTEPTIPNPGAEQDAKLKGNHRAGFEISVPRDQVFNPDGSKRAVRIFALTGDGAALEVYYRDTFQFRPQPP